MSTQVSTERLRIPKAGRMDSAKLNKFIDSTILDLQNLVTQSNANEARTDQVLSLVLRETANLKQRLTELEDERDFEALIRSWQNLRIPVLKAMTDFSGITYLSGSANAVHPNINTTFGQATVPINSIQSKFYTNSIISGSIVPIAQSLNTTITAVSEPTALTITEGTPANAFNGDNQSYWIRRLEFDLENDVSEVEVELIVQVPDQANAESNILYIKPYPIGQTDITMLATSPDLTDSFTSVQGFTAVDNAGNKRYFFSSQVVSQVKIRLRQRNWFEENGKKVFEYGLQELGLQLAEFDQTWDASAALTQNHAFVTKFVAPAGFNFSGLHLFQTTPDYLKESTQNRHMHFKVTLNADGTSVLWDSDINASPQQLVQPISLGNSQNTLYVVTILNWVATADGGSPLFEVGTSPVLESIGLQYSVAPE